MGSRVKAIEKVVKTEIREKDGATYKYELILKESERFASYKIPLYSVSIEMNLFGSTTRARSRELFSDAEEAIIFFDRLVENLATPLNLRYIVEDELN